MADEIRVIVVRRKGLNLYLRYIDPVDGKRREKNSGTTSMKAAIRAAGEWQAELNASGVAPGLIRWDAFREEFREKYLAHYKAGYQVNVEGSLNVVEELMAPDTLSRISEKWLARLLLLAKKRGVSSFTVRKYFQHLQTALKWAKDQGYLRTVPNFPKQAKQTQKGAKLMKGRPITSEEFERMLGAVEKSMTEHRKKDPSEKFSAEISRQAESIRFLMRGLWLSGLRLGEALSLTWDQWADGIRVAIDRDGDVCLMIDGDSQKSGQATIYPVVDDFAEFLKAIPKEQRKGPVFNPCRFGKTSRRVDTVSNWICDVGEAAGVKVDSKNGKDKFASAHDFRRAFGTRWAKVLPPGILKELMRHASIETTMSFYVNIAAKDTIAEVRRHQERSQVNEKVKESEKGE